MKTLPFKSIVLTIVALAVVGIALFILKQPDAINQGTEATKSSAQRTGPWENLMDKREYWGDVKISEYIEWLQSRIYSDNVEPNLIYNCLLRLSEFGTTKSVQVLQEYLEINKRELPKSAPSKEEIGDVKIRMSDSQPTTPEGKVLSAIEHLIASGTPESGSTAMDAVAEIKAKYQGTEYGDIFSEYLDKTVTRGKALAIFNAEMRSKPILTR